MSRAVVLVPLLLSVAGNLVPVRCAAQEHPAGTLETAADGAVGEANAGPVEASGPATASPQPEVGLPFTGLGAAFGMRGPWGRGSRGLGLGLAAFYFHDFQTRLDYTFAESLVTVRDLGRGTSRTTRVPGDPALNNRKFDLELEVEGPGLQVPLALPGFEGRKGFSLYPTLAFEVAAADVTFDFLDRNQPGLSTSLAGSGPMFSAGFELTGRVCTSCPWSTSWSYWYRNLPDVSVGRSPRLRVPGQEVFLERVSLSRETHEVAARAAYAVGGAGSRRWLPYAGVLYQRTDVAVDDRLGLRSPGLDLETETLSRSRFAGDVVRALAGFDVQLSRTLFGRFETSAGEGDHGLRLLLLWNRWRWPKAEPAGVERPGGAEGKRVRRRAQELAVELAALLAKIEREFLTGWDGLTVVEAPPGEPSYLLPEVQNLLADTESAMLEALAAPELMALRDWVSDRFQWTRSALGIEVPRAAFRPLGGPRPASDGGRAAGLRIVGLHAAALHVAEARSATSTVERTLADERIERGAYEGICKPGDMAKGRTFDILLTFETRVPKSQRGGKTFLFIYPKYDRSSPLARKLPVGQTERLMRGSYSYDVEYEGLDDLHCDASHVPPGPTGICGLTLVHNPRAVLVCDDSSCLHEGPHFSDLKECKRHGGR